jgi:hypothetical protein
MEQAQEKNTLVIKVKVSDQPDLSIPASLCAQLDLADDDQVEVVHSGHWITLRKSSAVSSPRPLPALAGIIKSSRPVASVDIASVMTKRGYEHLDGQQDSPVD